MRPSEEGHILIPRVLSQTFKYDQMRCLIVVGDNLPHAGYFLTVIRLRTREQNLDHNANSSMEFWTLAHDRSSMSTLEYTRLCFDQSHNYKIKCRERLCTKNRVEMEVFPLRPSAYLCVLCVNGPFNAESHRDTQRPQRKQIRFATFCAKPQGALRSC